MKELRLTDSLMEAYATFLQEAEYATATVRKYARDLRALKAYLKGAPITKAALIGWKQQLMETHTPASINSMLAAANSLLMWLEQQNLCVKPLKIQKSLFLDEKKALSRQDYCRLVKAAEKAENRRLSLAMQTICSTGIRVSELKFITVEAVRRGRAEIQNKGKLRTVFLPKKLCRLLQTYIRREKKTAGAVFTTRTGRPLDRSNIWRDMKALCQSAGVDPEKVFPHNLRHLFARTYYALQKDMTKLADILGHSSINTTRIYTAETGANHARQIGSLALVIT